MENKVQRLTSLLPEDIIVAGILLRLHVKALFRFKCVSKRYESIISNPMFARKYVQQAYSSPESSSSSGLLALLLFPLTNLSMYRDGFTENVKELSGTVDSSVGSQYPDEEDQLSIYVSAVSLSSDRICHVIKGSSGGLILSMVHDPKYTIRFTLYVSNPLTKQCVLLPKATVTSCLNVVFGLATRCDRAAAWLTYKVVIFHSSYRRPKGTIEIFSSDIGSWVAWEVSWPRFFYQDNTQDTCFSYKGILHWLDRVEGTIITYDPYDCPDRFGRIMLPEGKYSLLDYDERDSPSEFSFLHFEVPEGSFTGHKGKYCISSGRKRNKNKSLIYSGEQEMLKYCEVGKCESEPGVDRLMVWQLVDYDKGKWCLEGEYSVPSLLYACKRLMFAPYPWNPDVICHPYLRSKTIAVINPRTRTSKLVDVFSKSEGAGTLRHKRIGYMHKFLPAEMCPWSSPFYAQSSHSSCLLV